MRKTFLFLFTIILSALSVAITSCSKDDNESIGMTKEVTETEDGLYDGILYYAITSNTTNSKEVAVVKCNQTVEHVEIPESIKIHGVTYDVTSVKSFESNYNNYCKVTTVTLPMTITRIDAKAFENCLFLNKINIPSSVKSVGYDAFEGCNNLCAVYITDFDAWKSIEFENMKSSPIYYTENLYINGELVKQDNISIDKLCGHWKVKVDVIEIKGNTQTHLGDIYNYGIFDFWTYSASDYSAQIWVDDMGNFWSVKAKCSCNTSALTITGEDVMNVYTKGTEEETCKITGKVIPDAVMDRSGKPNDSISVDMIYSTDPKIIYRYSGTRY